MPISLNHPIGAATRAPEALPEFNFVPLGQACKESWISSCAGALLSFVIASILMSGWPQGLIPETGIPFAYSNDALSALWLIQRSIEGWIFHNDRSGFPFGSSFLDYPGADAASFLILKFLGWITGSSAGALNLYYLLSFSANFIAAHLVLRSLRIGGALSFAVAMLFTFAPFHFLRLTHLFYSWYFVAPIYFYIGLQIALNGGQFNFINASWKRRTLLALGYLLMASFGVYFTAFGMLVISTACLIAFVSGNLKAIRGVAAPAIFFLAIGTAANIAPNALNEQRLGPNREVATRSPMESEVYGAKPMQLLLPRPGHRSPLLAEFTNNYNKNTPLVNENQTSSLGMIGVAGLTLLMLAALVGISGGRIDRRMSTLATMSLVLLAFIVVGGLGSLFAHLISPSIRGWNRASIFLSFSALAGFALFTQLIIEKQSTRISILVAPAVAALVLAIGLWDQTTPHCNDCNFALREAFKQDQAFIEEIERELGPGASLYQLPYMSFPESPPLHALSSYSLAAGFIHSNNLKWSFGGTRGRAGDLYFRSLSLLPVPDQLRGIQDKGFSAVYIDTHGYADGGADVIQSWTDILGKEPDIKRADGKVVLFKLKGSPRPEATTVAAGEISFDPLPPSQLFQFLGEGWSTPEEWGVWSDETYSTLHLPSPPNGATHLRIHFNGFVSQSRQLTVTAMIDGAKSVRMVVPFNRARNRTLDLPLPLLAQSGDLKASLKYDPPLSPHQAGISADKRTLALGLTSLQWVGRDSLVQTTKQ